MWSSLTNMLRSSQASDKHDDDDARSHAGDDNNSTASSSSASTPDQGSSPSSATTLPYSLETLKTACWVCECTLQLEPPHFCLYATHCHLHLHVAVCCLCSEQLLAIAEEQDNKEEDDDDDVCYGCASESQATTLLCCSDCEHEYCVQCVHKAVGNLEIVQQLLESDNDDDWKCLACDPPPQLRELQHSLNANATISTTLPLRTLDRVLYELKMVEEERCHCIQQLDQEDEQLECIQRELKCETDALEEFETWKELLLKHEKRLQDMISILQDELKESFQVKDIVGLYRALDLEPQRKEKTEDDDDDDDDDENKPEYAHAADKAISKRQKEEQKEQRRADTTSPTTILPKEAYERDDAYSDVEELASDDDGDDDDMSEDVKEWRRTSGFRSDEFLATRQKVQETLQEENRRLEECNKRKPVAIIRSEDDKRAILEEEQAVAGRSRVRKDAILAQKKKRSSREGRKDNTIMAGGGKSPFTETFTAPASASNLNSRDLSATVPTKPVALKDPPVPAGNVLVEPPTKPAMLKDPPICFDVLDDSSTDSDSSSATLLGLPARKNKKGATIMKQSQSQSQSQPSASQSSNYSSSQLPRKPKALPPEMGPLVLCRKNSSNGAIRTIDVARGLTTLLKTHQREAIVHMWNNCFVDFERHKRGNVDEVGGCILAHNMGLGKTLSTIALIHTVMTHHSMPVLKDGTSVINKVLVVVPSNTISNWMDEFKKWTGHLTPPLVVDSVLNHSSTLATGRAVERWDAKGGIFVMTDGKLLALFNKGRIGQPDLLVVDEAHSMLKVTTNKKFVALSSFETKRRILLTGTPFQNNLLEYFRMISFIRPNVFPGVSKESEFDAMYNKPIQEGEASDASRSQYHAYVQKTKEINALVSPYVHRKDASELRKVLPSLQQVVLHVRQSRIQCRLYNAYKRMQQQSDNDGNSPNYNNFLRSYQDQRPLHNHPGCLLVRSEKTKSDRASIDGGEKTKSRASNDGGSVCENNWWRRFLKPGEVERLSDVEAGYKIVLLLHILAASDKQNDKVLVFSESIPTLNFVEGVLAMPDWKKKVPSLASSFPEMQNLGGWKKDRDFLRIDGTTSSEDRGVLVDLFNSSQGRGSEVKAFLISTVAGGVGINLTAANRVVLLDSNFNPAISSQALFRSYRYGQEKEVFVYRMLTEGSIEQKIYARSVMKNGLALRVIDDKSFERSFTKSELADLSTNITWVQCDNCNKWRMLSEGTGEELPDKWYCKDNVDLDHNSCDRPERTQTWHEQRQMGLIREQQGSPLKSMAQEEAESQGETAETLVMVERDSVLQELLNVEQKDKQSKLVSRYYFHDALLTSSKDTSEELESARKAAQATDSPHRGNAVNLSDTFAVEAACDTAVNAYADKKPAAVDAKSKIKKKTVDGTRSNISATEQCITKANAKDVAVSMKESKKSTTACPATPKGQTRRSPENSLDYSRVYDSSTVNILSPRPNKRRLYDEPAVGQVTETNKKVVLLLSPTESASNTQASPPVKLHQSPAQGKQKSPSPKKRPARLSLFDGDLPNNSPHHERLTVKKRGSKSVGGRASSPGAKRDKKQKDTRTSNSKITEHFLPKVQRDKSIPPAAQSISNATEVVNLCDSDDE